MDERIARVLKIGLNAAFEDELITQDEYFDALGYVNSQDN